MGVQDKIIAVQIGNSDNKLSQLSWSMYVNSVINLIMEISKEINFFGASVGYEPWQNAAWIFAIESDKIEELKTKLTNIRTSYDQDSIAFSVCETDFI